MIKQQTLVFVLVYLIIYSSTLVNTSSLTVKPTTLGLDFNKQANNFLSSEAQSEWINNLKSKASVQDNNGPFTSGSWYLGDAQVYDESCNYFQVPFTKLVSTGSELTLSNPISSTTYTLSTFVKRPFSDNLYFGLVTYSGTSLPICMELNTNDSLKLSFTFDILTCTNVESFTASCKLDSSTNKISQVTYVYKSPGAISSITVLGIVLLIGCIFTSLVCCIAMCVCLCTRLNSRRSLTYQRVN